MEYGIPYLGSKNTIAEQIVSHIPKGGVILDACCGGGAFLQCAAQSLRWEKVVGNDINPAVIKLLDAIFIHKGQIDYEHPAICDRNDFFVSLQKIENGTFDVQDCVNKFCASFGNDGKNYLYGKDIEEIKTTAEKMLSLRGIENRKTCYRKFMELINNEVALERFENLQNLNQIERFQRLESFGRLRRLERLGRLRRLERLENMSIFDIDYSEFDIVYFDIPYKGTSKYDFEFDHEKFYELFASLPIPAFISEYDSPFVCVAEFDKAQNLAPSVGSTGKIKGLEKLYFNGTLDEYKELMGAEYEERIEQAELF